MSSDEDIQMDEVEVAPTFKFKGKGKAANGDAYLHTEDQNLPWYASSSSSKVGSSVNWITKQGGEVPPSHAGRRRISQRHNGYK